MDDLATRLAAHPRYRWMAGMLAVHAGKGEPQPRARCLHGLADHSALYQFTGWQGGEVADVYPEYVAKWFLPDLADPATAGCLRALLHEAAPLVYLSSWADGRTWQAWDIKGSPGEPVATDVVHGRCVAEALLVVWGPA